MTTSTRPNINQTTGIAYGVIAGNSIPDMLDDIQSNGTDLNWDDFREQVKLSVQAAIESSTDEDDGSTDIQAIRQLLTNHIDDYCFNPGKLVARFSDDELASPDTESITQALFDLGIGDGYESDSFDYSYTDGEYTLQTGTLGGAILVWVIESPYLTYAPQCSPCVPFAKDLDSDQAGDYQGEKIESLGYCLSPDDMPGTWEVAEQIEYHGKSYSVLRKIEQCEHEPLPRTNPPLGIALPTCAKCGQVYDNMD